jgi:hypothetical protein
MSECGGVEVEVSEVVSKRERRVMASVVDLLANPHALEVLAAQLDETAAGLELHAARARKNAVTSEARGDMGAVEMWSEVADTAAALAKVQRKQRAELVARLSCRRQPADCQA